MHATKTNNTSVGLALGGGGVRGLGHVPALETIDACGIRPTRLAGTSMGALIGALYASGKSGQEIRALVEQLLVTRDEGLRAVYAKKDVLLKWLTSIRLAWKSSGLLDADGFLRHLIEQMGVTTFEELEIPLHVVATDFYAGEPVIFSSGPLLPALKATMAVPGVFVPVEHEGKILVDGGVCNNLPYNLLTPYCDTTIAIDVSPTREKRNAEPPRMIDATLGMFDILVEKITKAMIEAQPPSLYFHPRLVGIRLLEFDKAEDVFAQMEVAVVDLRKMLTSGTA